MRISVERVPSESRMIKTTIIDDMATVTEGVNYTIMRKDFVSENQLSLITIDPFAESDQYTIKVLNDKLLIEFVDATPLYATDYLYKIFKRKETVNIEMSGFISATTLPQKPGRLEVNEVLSEFDENGIPTSFYFEWGSIQKDLNTHILGYNLFYSTSKREENNWSEWKRVIGKSTINTIGDPLLISLDDCFAKIDVPQISDTNEPLDMRFTVTTVDSGPLKLNSRFTNVFKFTMHDLVCKNINKDEDSSISLEKDSFIIRPVTINVPANSFDSDCSMMIRKSHYDPPIKNYPEKYTYELNAGANLEKFVSVSIDIELYSGQHYEVRVLDGTDKWTQIPATYNMRDKKVTFILSEITTFSLMIKDTTTKSNDINHREESKFNYYTNKIINKLPSWSKIRRTPSQSKGAFFLNVFGLEFEDVEYILKYAYEQTHIETADISQADIIYKVQLPNSFTQDHALFINSDNVIFEEADTLEYFLKPQALSSLMDEINYDNLYLIDYEKKILYVKKPYNKSKDNKFGYLNISIYESVDEDPIFKDDISLKIHHVWNFFDEFGMLLDTPRLLGEINADYKERILDVFKNISNSSKEGLMNGIARELGIRVNKQWLNPSMDFIIKEPMVIANYIKVNGEIVPKSRLYFTSENYIVIKAEPDTPVLSEVTYVSGLEMHTFHNKEDYYFQNQLYTVNNTATDIFKHYVKMIKERVPIEWGQFKWNEGFWDIADEKMSGYGFLPSLMDASITGFKKYRK